MTGTAAATGARRRLRAHVAGTVQGVGFRPFVYRLAAELGLGGWVLNDGRGVVLEVEGPPEAVDELLTRLRSQPPPLAAIESVRVEPAAPTGERGFRDPRVRARRPARGPGVARLRHLRRLPGRDPRSRRPPLPLSVHQLHQLRPALHDRARRPLRPRADHDGRVRDVRGAATPSTTIPPTAASTRSPTPARTAARELRLVDTGGGLGERSGGDALEAAAACSAPGAILAIKGIGGYHLACVAADEAAVAALRARKHREAKPLALMVARPRGSRASSSSSTRPRSAADRAARGRSSSLAGGRRRVAPAVAPGSRDLGVMLPYSPLHHLLLADVGRAAGDDLGNVSDEPIAYLDDDARERLARIADAFLVHDRPIWVRTDDSVLRASRRPSAEPIILRRSRGTRRPRSPAGRRARPVLGCGAELKSTFCLARGDRAWVGHHIGDLRTGRR